ncbi:polcalcin Phl p 7-like [Dendrobium catenatum]|uniref:Polcalcin Jun o 2 n=1 Tax=Dendrobium catenatum TaxID=906689 RepID=A0A2I0VFD2_9ASPA|nr:polcalcin Phl p 7-like [Dendrobium catenatum]PKU62138.1 Polcalcin Jun o 2 [Dendrobium catenatum]
MAITATGTTTTRALSGDMTIEEFRQWIRRFDVNGDGRISRNELRHAIRSIGVRFSGWRSNRWIRQADANGDGFIDVEGEIDNLLDYAKSNLGINIVAY